MSSAVLRRSRAKKREGYKHSVVHPSLLALEKAGLVRSEQERLAFNPAQKARR